MHFYSKKVLGGSSRRLISGPRHKTRRESAICSLPSFWNGFQLSSICFGIFLRQFQMHRKLVWFWFLAEKLSSVKCMQYGDENRETIEKWILMKIQRENVQSRNKNDVGAHRKRKRTKNQAIANKNNINLS